MKGRILHLELEGALEAEAQAGALFPRGAGSSLCFSRYPDNLGSCDQFPAYPVGSFGLGKEKIDLEEVPLLGLGTVLDADLEPQGADVHGLTAPSLSGVR